MFKHLTIIVAFVITLSSPVVAQDLQKGYAAYNAGDYATAFKMLMPVAKAGNADAQFQIGSMYQYGRGVPQDYKGAVKWYRLASHQGDFYLNWLLDLCMSVAWVSFKTTSCLICGTILVLQAVV